MDRRRFIGVVSASLPLLVSAPALSQDRPSVEITTDEILQLALTPPLFFLMLAEMDACWIVLIEGSPSASAEFTVNARQAYLKFRTQLTSPDSLNRVVNAMKSSDWKVTAEQLTKDLQPILVRVRQQIIQNGVNEGSRLVNVFVRAFNGFTQSLRALSADNDHWYCHCYGLELLCKG